jgi:ABC-2 type transport system permease protein
MAQTSKGNSVPSTASQIWTVAKYEFKNYFGSRRFYILLIITLLIGFLLTVVVAHYRPPRFLQQSPDPQLGFYASWWGDTVTLVVVLSAIFFGGDAVSSEFQNRTGYFLVPNPLRRSAIYAGKWISALVASLLIFAVFLLITLANGVYYFGASVPSQFVESLGFSIVYLVAVMAFSFFFSSLFKSTTYSIVLTAILFLFAFSLVQEILSDLVQMEPWFVLTYAAGIISNVMQTPYPAQVVTEKLGRFTLTAYSATIPEGLEIMLVYFIVTAVLGLVFFERKDFT